MEKETQLQTENKSVSQNYYKAVGFMLASTLFFALMNVSVKQVSHLPALEIVFFRCFVSSGLTYMLIYQAGISPWGNNRSKLVLRGLIGSVALILFFITLQRIPLADAVTIQYTSPVFTTLMGVWVAKERVTIGQWIFVLLSFVGVAVIQGFDHRVEFWVLLMGLTASFLTGLAYTLVRQLTTSEHPLVIVFYFPLVALPLSGIYCLFDWQIPIDWDWCFLFLVGLTTQVAQYCVTRSYQLIAVSVVAPLNYLGILYAIALGYFIYSETYNIQSYLGMLLVASGVLASIFFAPQNNITKQ